ncbi:hypothetical protein FMEAI12_5290049 [Parafrankia sp. Ea1.12]|nr:hypothetical protein FMEAI12_5290049 [Parafrankia sp. Ea1.12]
MTPWDLVGREARGGLTDDQFMSKILQGPMTIGLSGSCGTEGRRGMRPGRQAVEAGRQRRPASLRR